MKIWFRLKVARLFNINNSYCWADLVTWTLSDDSFLSVFKCKYQECRKGNPNRTYPYCGKCRMTGNYNKLATNKK